jgi:nucleotide-binding universal stress UspA family protein
MRGGSAVEGGFVFKSIACAADGSPAARRALEVAAGLSRTVGGKLVIIYVQEITISRTGFLAEDSAGTLAELDRTGQQLRLEGIDATVQRSNATGDDTPRKILELAERAGADVLVAGNRRHGPLANLVLGSVATRLLQLASCPVLLVPSKPDEGTVSTDSDA